MKKISLLCLTLISINTFAESSFSYKCTPFTGPYAGLGIGNRYVAIKDKQSSNIHAPEIFSITMTGAPQVSINKIIGEINIGYGVTYQQLYLALEGRGIFSGADKKSINTILTENNSQLILSNNLNIKIKNEYGLLFKLGYLFMPSTILYGLIGSEWMSYSANTNTDYMQNIGADIIASTTNSHSETRSGLLVGVGIEHLITNTVSIGLEYTYVNYSSLHYPMTTPSTVTLNDVPFPGSALSENHHLSSRVNNVVLKLNYYFM